MQNSRSLRQMTAAGSQPAGALCRFALTLAVLLSCITAAHAGRTLPTPSLTASQLTSSAVTLNWTDPYSSEINWTVERAASSAGPFAVLATLPSGSLTYRDASLSAGGTYFFRVGYLTSKNGRKYSNTLQVNAPAPDLTAPVATITSPSAGATVRGSISLSASATDNASISRVEFYVDNTLVGTDTASPYALSLNTATIADGTHSIIARAYDTSGNASDSAAVTFVTDNSAVAPAAAAQAVAYNQISVTWSPVSDASGVASYRIYRGGSLVATVTTAGYTDNAVNGSTTYCYSVATLDVLGNVSSQSASSCATTPAAPDTTAPSVPQSVSAVAASCSQVNISWASSTDSGSGVLRYNIYRNGALWRQVTAPSTGTSDASVSASTAYTYAVSATDNAGNTSAQSSPASVTTTACADTVAPSVPASVSAAAAGCQSNLITWAASTDTGGSGLKGYRILRNGTNYGFVAAPATSAADVAVINGINYTYAVCAQDNAGNESPLSEAASALASGCNLRPVAQAAPSQSAVAGATVSFDGSSSYDPDGTIVAFSWTFGDGGTASGSIVSHAYSAVGTFTATLTVTDNGGATASASVTVTISAPPTSGHVIWGALSGGTAMDSANAVAFLGSDIISGGYYNGRMFLSRLASNGPVVWTRNFGLGSITAVTVDSASNIFVGGNFSMNVDFGGVILTTPSMEYDLFIAKYTPDGRLLWVKQFGAGAGANALEPPGVFSLATDANADIAAAGAFTYSANFGGGVIYGSGNQDGFVAKLRGTDGSHLWSRGFCDNASSSLEAATGVAIDAAGNIVVAGQFSGTTDFGSTLLTSAGGSDIFVAKYSSAGVPLWAKRFGGANSEETRGLAADNQGNIVIAGAFAGTLTIGDTVKSAGFFVAYDAFVARLASDGTPLWCRSFGSDSDDAANSVTTTTDGSILLTASMIGSAYLGSVPITGLGGSDIIAARISSAGAFQWAENVGGNDTDDGFGIAVSRTDGTVAIAGRITGTSKLGAQTLTASGGSDACILKLRP